MMDEDYKNLKTAEGWITLAVVIGPAILIACGLIWVALSLK